MRRTALASMGILVSGLVLGLVGCGGDDGGGGTGDGDGGPLPVDAGNDGIPAVPDAPPGGSPGSLRFFNSHAPNADRVAIRIDPNVPADIGAGSFTIELWFRLGPGVQLPATCAASRDGWRGGHIILDRDRSADGPRGEFGLALYRNGVAFGMSQGTTGVGLCGTVAITSGWHHVAVTRDVGTRAVTLYYDGVASGTVTGPAGDISYQDGVAGGAQDPFLVLGAEKTDAAGLQGFDGFVDELRLSTVVRYTADFTIATTKFDLDADTAALYHFNDGGGLVLGDERAMSPGDVKFGTDGNGAAVPLWVSGEPFLN